MKIQENFYGQEKYLLRRWSLKIRDVRIQNAQKEPLTIFLQFMIGGNFEEKQMITPAGKKITEVVGKKGQSFKSELMKDIESSEIRNMNLNIEREIIASYEQIEREFAEIEVWQYSRWKVNTFLGKTTIRLSNIVDGHINRQCVIRKHSGGKKAFCRIFFTLYFQEIWDFHITFNEWKGNNLIQKRGKPMNPKIRLSLMTKQFVVPRVFSDLKKKQSNPYWENLSGYMHFRGTLDELEDHFLLITLYNGSFSKAFKLVSLRGIARYPYIKTTFILHKNSSLTKNEDSDEEQHNKKQKDGLLPNLKVGQQKSSMTNLINNNQKLSNPSEMQKYQKYKEQDLDENSIHPELLENEYFDELNAHFSEEQNISKISNNSENSEKEVEDLMKGLPFDLEKQKIYATLEGRINLNLLPKYQQKGELIRFRKGERYLSINIFRVENVIAADDRGIINSFVTIEWGGQVKSSQTFYDSMQPEFNEEIFFKIPISKKKKEIDCLKEELSSKPEININLWIEGDEHSTNENSGFCKFHIGELQQSPKDVKPVIDFFTRKKINHLVRTATVTRKFSSALVELSNTQILFSVCIFPDLPDEIDLRDFPSQSQDKYPKILLKEMLKKNSSENKFYKKWEDSIKQNFSNHRLDQIQAHIFFNYTFMKDQYGNSHFLPKFIDKYAIPEYNMIQSGYMREEEKQEQQIETRLKTFSEIWNFVKTIPIQENIQSLPNVIISPDFLSILRKGSVADHAILLTCLFMGAKFENEEEILKPNLKEIQKFDKSERIFCCIGTHK